MNLLQTEAVAQRCSVKKGVRKIHGKTPVPKSLPVNFEKFLRTPFFTEHLWWLLLYKDIEPLKK